MVKLPVVRESLVVQVENGKLWHMRSVIILVLVSDFQILYEKGDLQLTIYTYFQSMIVLMAALYLRAVARSAERLAMRTQHTSCLLSLSGTRLLSRLVLLVISVSTTYLMHPANTLLMHYCNYRLRSWHYSQYYMSVCPW